MGEWKGGRGGSIEREVERCSLMLVVSWQASALRGKEAECFHKVAGMSIIAAGSLRSIVDTSNCRHPSGLILLATDDLLHRQFLAKSYQLAPSVLKIGSALAERMGQGEVGGCTPLADSAWRPLQLPVEKSWSMPGGPFVCFLARTGIEKSPFTL